MYQNVHGGDVYEKEIRLDFSVNINPFGIPESVIGAACEGIRCSQAYPDTRCRALTRALAQAHQAEEEHILCSSGAAELIYALCFAARPKKALLVSPGFAEYEQALRLAGCREVVFYETKREHDFALGEDYLSLITEDLDLLFLCNPNNPTGNALDRDFLERVLRRC